MKKLLLSLAILLIAHPVHAATIGSVSTLSIITEVNKYRATQHEVPLIMITPLNQSAQDKANYLLKTKTFAHGNFGATIEKRYTKWSFAGENLAIYRGTSKDIVNAWIKSPEHRAIMVDKRFKYVGVGVSKSYDPRYAVIVAMHVTN